MGNKVTPIQETDLRMYDSPLVHVLKPIHISMQIFGIFFLDCKSEIEKDRKTKSKSCQSSFNKCYCICSTVVSGLNILRYIPSFWVGIDYIPDITVWRIINLSWFLQCFINRVFMLRACWSSDHLQSFFRNFDVIIVDRSACGESTESKYNKMKKLVTFRTIVIWGFFFFTAASIILQSVTEYNKYFVAGIINPFPHGYIPVTIFFVSLQVWEIGAWLFPILYQVTLFKFLCSGFTSLNNDISKMIEDNSKKIKDIRGKHLQLCKTVAILEEDSKYLLTGTYVTNIFLLCFIVYQMLTSGTLPVIEYLTYSCWLAMNALITIIVSLTAAEVNEKAHSPLDYIYDVDMSETCAFQSVELQMFLFKLNGPAVGFTTMGFVTITKELILTLGGIILTYFLLLIQFKL